MGKYKKKLRAEKAKVKIKKKKLPKGQNITDTTFKVKKIVTVEQLKKVKENEPVSSWNVPLKDLLIHLGHHNKTSRLNGLNGIKEVIINYPDILKGPTLKNTLLKVLEVMSDIEAKVRAAAISVLDTLFSKLNESEILPFYEVLNIHLACVMTHRQVEIQKDSLRLTDIIIKYAPDAIKKNFKIIMVNFIRILSGYKYGAQSEILLIKGSKRDLEENRIAIFHRLNRILHICYPDKSAPAEERKIILSARNPKLFSKKMFTSFYEKTTDLSEIFKHQSLAYTKMTFEDCEEDFKTLMSQTMPLLFETWAEFSPCHDNNGFLEECVIKENTAKLLGLILGIIAMFCERSLQMESDDLNLRQEMLDNLTLLLQKKLFTANYGNQFVRLFLSSFPYLPQMINRNTVKEVEDEESTFSYSKIYQVQNLTICYLVYKMKLKITDELREVLDNYVSQALMIRNTKYDELLSKILEIKLLGLPKQKKTDKFLELAVKAFKHTTNEALQSRLLHILSSVASGDYVQASINSCIKEWTPYLAKGLCKKKISFKTLETMSKLIRTKKGDDILREIELKFCDIIRNLEDVVVEGCDPYEGMKYLVNILFWCDNTVIKDALDSNVFSKDGYSNDIKEYVMKVLNFKLKISGE